MGGKYDAIIDGKHLYKRLLIRRRKPLPELLDEMRPMVIGGHLYLFALLFDGDSWTASYLCAETEDVIEGHGVSIHLATYELKRKVGLRQQNQ